MFFFNFSHVFYVFKFFFNFYLNVYYRSDLVDKKSFLHFVLEDRLLADLVELELVEEDVFRYLEWPLQSTATLIVVQHRLQQIQSSIITQPLTSRFITTGAASDFTQFLKVSILLVRAVGLLQLFLARTSVTYVYHSVYSGISCR